MFSRLKDTIFRHTAFIFCVSFVVFYTSAVSGAERLLGSIEASVKSKTGIVQIIDVRNSWEWKKTGVPKGAWTITIHGPKGLAGFVSDVIGAVGGNKSKPVALICARGARSAQAAASLKLSGFQNVWNIREGILGNKQDGIGWLKQKLPVEKCKGC